MSLYYEAECGHSVEIGMGCPRCQWDALVARAEAAEWRIGQLENELHDEQLDKQSQIDILNSQVYELKEELARLKLEKEPK